MAESISAEITEDELQVIERSLERIEERLDRLEIEGERQDEAIARLAKLLPE